MEQEQPPFEEERKRLVASFDTPFFFKKTPFILGCFCFLFLCYLIIRYVFSAPVYFPDKTSIIVTRGSSLQSLAHDLKEKNIIRSETLFQFFVILFGGEKRITPGEYYFETPAPVYTVAYRIGERMFGVQKIKITIPEGVSNKEVAEILTKKLSGFDGRLFLEQAKNKEGYLFPETYFFFPNTQTEEIIETLENTFERKTSTLFQQKNNTRFSEKEVIILASLLEKEARGYEEMRIVSGILQKRLEKNIPLQVDAPFVYILGKGSSELTLSDLRADNPYNTYTRTGLPPTAIGNPGLAALQAVLSPVESPYFFYLHGTDGKIHYARTFDEHKNNKARYLK